MRSEGSLPLEPPAPEKNFCAGLRRIRVGRETIHDISNEEFRLLDIPSQDIAVDKVEYRETRTK